VDVGRLSARAGARADRLHLIHDPPQGSDDRPGTLRVGGDPRQGDGRPPVHGGLARAEVLDPREKQALLEAADMQERADALIKLLQMGVFDTGRPATGPKQ